MSCQNSHTDTEVDDNGLSARSRQRISTAVVWILGIGAIMAWIGNFLYGRTLDGDAKGLFGDQFGAVNAIFSGLAFIGVVYSVSIQREDLRLARKSLKDGQKLFETQEDNIKRENFENTFFQLFKAFTDLLNNIKVSNSDKEELAGKDAFLDMNRYLQSCIRSSARRRIVNELPEQPIHAMNEGYAKFWDKHGHELGHYFRSLYTILRFIEDKQPETSEFYAKIVRAQLSGSEAAILYANYMVGHTTSKFNELVNKYGMLKHSNTAANLDDQAWVYADQRAFGDSHLKENRKDNLFFFQKTEREKRIEADKQSNASQSH